MGFKAVWQGWQRNLICMWISQFLVNLGFAAAFSFIPLYLGQEKFHIDEGMIGYYTSRFQFFAMLAYAIFTPLWGWLGDRWGMKLMLYRGSFITALIYPLMGLVGSVRTLIMLRFLTGALSGTTIAAKMLLVKTVPNERQGFALGVLETAIWGGMMIGEALGGQAVACFGFTTTFLLCGVLFFCSGIFVAFARDSEKSVMAVRADAPLRAGSAEKTAGVRWFFAPAIMMMMTVFLLCGVILRFYTPYTSLMIKGFVGTTGAAARWTGNIGAIAAAGAIFSGVMMGWCSDKFAEWKLTTPVQLLSALMLFFASGATSLFRFGLCYAANSLVTGGLYAVFQKVASGLVDRARRGTILGVASTMYNVGYMLSALLSGWIVTAWGLRWVYRGGAALMVLLAASSALVIHAVSAQKRA